MSVKETVRSELTVADLLDAGLHFGHQTKRWNPKMKRYIFEARNGIYIIDLTQSLSQIKKAQQFLHDTVSRGRQVLFVGTKKQAQEPIREWASQMSQPYVINRWLGGMLTNNRTIRESVKRLKELEAIEKNGQTAVGSKKEFSSLMREKAKMEKNLSGIAAMKDLPGALVVVDVNREHIAVKEANALNIPIVAITDTNVDPEPIDYPIPGNDDSLRSIRVVLSALGDTIQKASNEFVKKAAEEAQRRAEEEAKARKIADENRKKAQEEAKLRKAEKETARKAKVDADKKAAAEKKAATPEAAPAEAAAAEAAPVEVKAAE